jgi:putative tricarboxylic transport membrane protein
LFKQVGVAPAPIVLGLILGSIAEIGFVQSMLRGAAYPYPLLKLFENPLSHILIVMTLLAVAWPYLSGFYQHLKRRRKVKAQP